MTNDDKTAAPPTALVVEDDKNIAYLLQFILTREGFEVSSAVDGREALAMIDSLPAPSLALLDIMLPYMDGFQLITHIRAKPVWQEVPILVLTSRAQERDLVRALDAGANDYLVKPFQPGELLARTRRLVKA